MIGIIIYSNVLQIHRSNDINKNKEFYFNALTVFVFL